MIALSEISPQKGNEKTIAAIQFEMISAHSYTYTSDEVLFSVFVQKNKITNGTLVSEKEKFFSKGQPCFRSSPLAKRYGWGIHSDAKGKIAMYAMESDEYKKLVKDKALKHIKAMRSKRA